MTTQENYVVGLGEALWDVLPEGKKLGGAPANFAFHASQFGLPTRVVSAVGNDPFGREITETFRSKGLQTLIETVPFPTGTVQIELDAEGVPRYDIRENVAWDNIPFTSRLQELAGQTRAVCFGSLAQRNAASRQTINAFLDAMPAGEGYYKIFDINLRQNFYTRETICQSLERCNILKINDEELVVVGRLFGHSGLDVQEQCRALLEAHHLEMLILTCGAKGSYVFTPAGVSYVETPRVEVADTVGAGDSFTASFISALICGKSIAGAHQLAVDVSAYVCTQNGAMPPLPEKFKRRVL